jgi:hypothetical protein
MIQFILKHPRATYDMLGFLPQMWDARNPQSAREQANANYGHGGGWEPFHGFRMTNRGLEYPGDPPQPLIAEAKLREETIRLYDCSWVVIIAPDGSFEACRMD